MAALKHTIDSREEPDPKRQKSLSVTDASYREVTKCRAVLNPADCNLDFDIDENGLHGCALYEGGFAYCWSGARANVGITRGKYCFGCKVVSAQPVKMDDTLPDQQNICRVGISRGDDPVGNLGETNHSFGFGGTGKFSCSAKFLDYAEKFGVGDTIICAVDLENESHAVIGFSKNGKWMGIATHFNCGQNGLKVGGNPTGRFRWEFAMFPHVLLKNVVVEMQFSTEDGLIPEEGYKPWGCALEDGNAIMGPSFSRARACEVLMMVGLPASGKTTWAEKHAREHHEKRYVLLGTNLALDQMKVPGLLRKHNYGERFDLLMERATKIFNTLLARAAKIPRNYILDQTNVYKSARKRKLAAFTNYRKIAVVVFPTPEELKVRAEKRFKDMGKEVPADAVNEMLANYVLPKSKGMAGSDEFFDEVIFVEQNRGDSARYLHDMKQALHADPKSHAILSSSRESSVQSFHSFQRERSDASAVCSAASHGQSSYINPTTRFTNNIPTLASHTYSQGSIHVKPEMSSGGYPYGYGRESIPPRYEHSRGSWEQHDAHHGGFQPGFAENFAAHAAYGKNHLPTEGSYPSADYGARQGLPFLENPSSYDNSCTRPYYGTRSYYSGSVPRSDMVPYGRYEGLFYNRSEGSQNRGFAAGTDMDGHGGYTVNNLYIGSDNERTGFPGRFDMGYPHSSSSSGSSTYFRSYGNP